MSNHIIYYSNNIEIKKKYRLWKAWHIKQLLIKQLLVTDNNK